MPQKRELFPFVHIYNGPTSSDDIHFLATNKDGGAQLCCLVSATMATWRTVIPQLQVFLDPRTVALVQSKHREIERYLHEGYGSLWVTPERIRLMVPREPESERVEGARSVAQVPARLRWVKGVL